MERDPLEWRHNEDVKSPASRMFTHPLIQAKIKESIKAPRQWPLCEEFTGDRWIPAQGASNAENVSIWWLHHENLHGFTSESSYVQWIGV